MDLKSFGSKKICCQKIFGSKKYVWVQKECLGPKRMVGSKKNVWVQKECLSPKNLSTKNILDQNFFCGHRRNFLWPMGRPAPWQKLKLMLISAKLELAGAWADLGKKKIFHQRSRI